MIAYNSRSLLTSLKCKHFDSFVHGCTIVSSALSNEEPLPCINPFRWKQESAIAFPQKCTPRGKTSDAACQINTLTNRVDFITVLHDPVQKKEFDLTARMWIIVYLITKVLVSLGFSENGDWFSKLYRCHAAPDRFAPLANRISDGVCDDDQYRTPYMNWERHWGAIIRGM